MSDARLSQYGGSMIRTDDRPTVEMINPNDNASKRFQYRRSSDGGVEKRVLCDDGTPMRDGSPWERLSAADVAAMAAARGEYHPILDPLGL